MLRRGKRSFCAGIHSFTIYYFNYYYFKFSFLAINLSVKHFLRVVLHARLCPSGLAFHLNHAIPAAKKIQIWGTAGSFPGRRSPYWESAARSVLRYTVAVEYYYYNLQF